MNLSISLQFLVVLAIVGVLTGITARTLNKTFTTWFVMGACLPFVSCVVLLCLPRKLRY